MKKINLLFMLFILAMQVQAQNEDQGSKTVSIVIKKGQALDLINGTRIDGTDELVNEYFQQVFPIATKSGYTINSTFITTGAPLQGNFNPRFFVFSSWPDKSNRDEFTKGMNASAYDHHLHRRKIYSSFNMTRYDNLEEDISFTVSEGKVYIVSSYWLEDQNNFEAFWKTQVSTIKKSGGKVLFKLGKGYSPTGYLYEPNVIVLTEWNNNENFESFIAQAGEASPSGLKNINMWQTQFLPQ